MPNYVLPRLAENLETNSAALRGGKPDVLAVKRPQRALDAFGEMNRLSSIASNGGR